MWDTDPQFPSIVNTIKHRGRNSMHGSFSNRLAQFCITWSDVKQFLTDARLICIIPKIGSGVDIEKTIRSSLPVAGWLILSNNDTFILCTDSDEVSQSLIDCLEQLADEHDLPPLTALNIDQCEPVKRRLIHNAGAHQCFGTTRRLEITVDQLLEVSRHLCANT